MPINAKLKNIRISPRKVRLIADLVRGKDIEKAQAILNFAVKKGSPVVLKLLKQAIANAKNNLHLDTTNLYISKITVDEGPKIKRWMPRARGSASPIQKKTSHITITLDAIEGKLKKIKQTETEKIEKEEKIEETKESKIKDTKKMKTKPEFEIKKPQMEKGKNRIFRRKAF